jgi:ribosomal protein S27E
MAASDTLRIMCPNLTCRKILAVPTSARGKTVRCRGCATNIRIPTGAVEPKAETPADPKKSKNAA